jgi:amidase
MDRRDFVTGVGVLSLAIATSERAHAVGRSFDPTEMSISALQAAMVSGAASAQTLTAAYLARIARYDQHGPEHRSVLAINSKALADAGSLDREREAGKVRGPLHGIPILLKDNIESRDPLPTTAGSYALEHSMRSDAPLAARLRAAGAVIMGKTNLSEWANFRSTRSCSGWSGIGGQTRNAYARDRNPSGSSAGSGVATAACFCAAAIGTETNGSILSPSSMNGLVGFKPTVGLVSGRGVVPISPRQDTAGPMCRSVADAAILANIIGERPLGYGNYGTSLEDFRLHGVRIGVMPPSSGLHPGTHRLFTEARSVIEKEGATLIDLEVPEAFGEIEKFSLTALLYEFKASINEYLAGLDPAQVQARSLAALIAFNQEHKDRELPIFGQEIFEMAAECGPLSDEKYQKGRAGLDRAVDTNGLMTLLEKQSVAVLMSPSNGPAELIDPVWGDRRGGGGPQIAGAAAIAGYPSITVPAGLTNGLPVGVTFVGRRNQDGLLLQVAHAFERAASARVAPRLAAGRSTVTSGEEPRPAGTVENAPSAGN